ncbi:YhzD family protein [Solibacillus cecembensis]|uniref:YhzD family protein n=1 Tax=Solibacillus cecembensis TaxID=459347 RepID=UPI0007171BCB
MENYRFTAFEKTGETLFDEVWTFANDETAKIEGQKQIDDNGISEKAHRLVNSTGKLILFHV